MAIQICVFTAISEVLRHCRHSCSQKSAHRCWIPAV